MLTVIRRCPSCPLIKDHMKSVLEALSGDFHIDAVMQDGDPGEFAIFVNGVEVIRGDSNSLPDVEEIEAAVKGASHAGV
ncbi:hypothetical protein [Zavarzinella formosa]|uniref:hypothetical protein n=1 Tax=Zavarzinella formosa TaxID=360055 RepID=UPI000A034BF4|nr:hypothetical protein [Zavarzinella formosa]